MKDFVCAYRIIRIANNSQNILLLLKKSNSYQDCWFEEEFSNKDRKLRLSIESKHWFKFYTLSPAGPTPKFDPTWLIYLFINVTGFCCFLNVFSWDFVATQSFVVRHWKAAQPCAGSQWVQNIVLTCHNICKPHTPLLNLITGTFHCLEWNNWAVFHNFSVICRFNVFSRHWLQ